MNTIKENSKVAFNQQAATYDKDIKGQHARSKKSMSEYQSFFAHSNTSRVTNLLP